MSPRFHSYEPRRGHGLAHDPFNAIIAPRPIGWIGSQDADGRHNLAPYSFFNAFNYVPPIVGFASVGRKDSLRNAEQTGVFTWNLVTRPLAEAMNQTSAPVAPEINEFERAGLTMTRSQRVDAPRVADSPVTFECRTSQILQLRGADGSDVETWLVLGEVVMVHIDEVLIVDGSYDTAAADPILRAGGGDYFGIDVAQRFCMTRPPT